MTRVLCVTGSTRAQSHTRKLMGLLRSEIESAGGACKVLDLGETPLPIYNPDPSHPDPHQTQARELVLWADAFVLGSPDYHGSMSGPIKNFLDHFWLEFTGKLFGYVVSTHEKGLTVQDQMRTAVRQCYAWSLPYGIGFNGDEAFNGRGELVDDALARRLTMMAHDLVTYGGVIRDQLRADLARQPPTPGFANKLRN